MNDRIEQMASGIYKAELKILEDFAKVYLAALSLEGRDLAQLIRDGKLKLNRKDPGPNEPFTYEYWYSISD